jgi:hypothetical protein
MNTRFRSHASFPDNPVFFSLFAALSGLLCTVLLLLVGAAAVCAQEDPAVWILPICLAALFIASAVCGIICGQSSAPLLCGFCGGGTYALLLTLLSLIPFADSHTALPAVWNILLHIGIVGCSILGAFLSQKRKPRNKRLFIKRRF